MWMAKELEFKGLKQLDKALEQLPLKVQKKVMTGAVRAGANVMKKQAKKEAPVSENGGYLRDSIIARKKKKAKLTELVYEVGPSREAYYGLMQEIGFIATGPKEATGKGLTYREFRARAKATRTAKGKKGATHVPGKHWLRKAFNLTFRRAMEKTKANLTKGIEREAAKLGNASIQ